MVNQYIKEAVSLDFTAKDFRTWAGSLHALREFRALGEAPTATESRKNVIAVLDAVSRQLGNTRTVCKKYYVHPGLIRLYEENKLINYLGEPDTAEPDTAADKPELSAEEKLLMKILIKKEPVRLVE